MQCRALGAQAAEIRRMRVIAAYAGDAFAVGFDHNPAADTAVATGGFERWHGNNLATDVPVTYII